jgi:hypothetical protein
MRHERVLDEFKPMLVQWTDESRIVSIDKSEQSSWCRDPAPAPGMSASSHAASHNSTLHNVLEASRIAPVLRGKRLRKDLMRDSPPITTASRPLAYALAGPRDPLGAPDWNPLVALLY